MKEDRSEYRTRYGIAAYWQKDGLWHVALPCITNLVAGGLRWTADEYHDRDEAIAAIPITGETLTVDNVS